MFVRVDAQTYINLDQVVKIESGVGHSVYSAVMSDGSRQPIRTEVWEVLCKMYEDRFTTDRISKAHLIQSFEDE
jgi:hypothetical protein